MTKTRSRRSHDKTGGKTHKLVVTLDAQRRAVVRIEMVEPSGKTRSVSDSDLAALAGVPGFRDLQATLEDAYAQGLTDGLECLVGDELQGIEFEDLKKVSRSTLETERRIAGTARGHLLRQLLSHAKMRSSHNGKQKHAHLSNAENQPLRDRRRSH